MRIRCENDSTASLGGRIDGEPFKVEFGEGGVARCKKKVGDYLVSEYDGVKEVQSESSESEESEEDEE